MGEEVIEDAEIVEHGELVVRAPQAEIVQANLFGVDDPVAVVEQAARVAKALAEVVRKQDLTTSISGREHVRVEGWQLLGSMLGVFPVLESCEPVERRGVEGYRATMTAQTRDGNIVGRADAYCMRDESKWKTRDEYAVASMAQTRATSKALKGPLGFVMKLAGFEPTPAEEMDFATREEAPVAQDSEIEKAGVLKALDAELKRLEGVPGWSEAEVIGAARGSFGRPRAAMLTDFNIEQLNQILEVAKAVVKNDA